jgi:hypothetical protein
VDIKETVDLDEAQRVMGSALAWTPAPYDRLRPGTAHQGCFPAVTASRSVAWMYDAGFDGFADAMQTMGWLSLILLAVGSVLVLVSVAFRKREGLIATTGLVCLVAGILLLIFGHDLLHS